MTDQPHITIKDEECCGYATFSIADIKARTHTLSNGQEIEIAVDLGNCVRTFQATFTRGHPNGGGDLLSIKLGHGASITLTENHACDVSLDRRGELFYHLHTR